MACANLRGVARSPSPHCGARGVAPSLCRSPEGLALARPPACACVRTCLGLQGAVNRYREGLRHGDPEPDGDAVVRRIFNFHTKFKQVGADS